MAAAAQVDYSDPNNPLNQALASLNQSGTNGNDNSPAPGVSGYTGGPATANSGGVSITDPGQGGNKTADPNPYIGGDATTNQANAANATSNATAPTGSIPATAPSGGSLSDPNYASQLIAYYGNQPGVNPSVKNDPNYWAGRIASGAFGNDQAYLVQRFMTPEGAPEGQTNNASGQSPAFTLSSAPNNSTDSSGVALPAAVAAPTATSMFGAGSKATTQSNDLYNMLMGRATQSLNVDPNDPVIRNQTDAYAAQQERARRNYLQQTAESAGPSANISAENRSSAETAGQNTSGFQAGLIANEISARRQEIQSALSGAQGLLTSEQAMQLQEELGQLNVAEQSYQTQMNQNTSVYGTQVGANTAAAGRQESQYQFDRQLAQNAYQYDTTQGYLNSPLAPGAAGG